MGEGILESRVCVCAPEQRRAGNERRFQGKQSQPSPLLPLPGEVTAALGS